MNSIRKLITTPSIISTSFSITRSAGIINTTRSIGYLHKGPRVRGLLRDEADYLVSPKGLTYGENEENLSSLKSFLGEEYKLPNNIALQILTHKSFSHGLKPFNEKLAIFGSHFLKFKTSVYQITSENNLSSEKSINGLELEQLGTLDSRNLISKFVLAEFIRQQNIGDSIFWKKRNPLITNSKVSGEDSVYARSLEAIVGAIILQHGKSKAEKFVDEILLNKSNEKSLVKIAESTSV